MAVKKGGLGPKGKGLDALFDSEIKSVSHQVSKDTVQLIDITKLSLTGFSHGNNLRKMLLKSLPKA